MLATAALTLSGCERQSPATVTRSNQVMGTLAAVTAIAPDQQTAEAAVAAAYERLDDVNRLMSDYVEDSEIGRLNRLAPGETMTLSPETYECLSRAIQFHHLSGGTFDPTCRPLVWLWKDAAKRGALPSEAEIAEAQERTGPDKLMLDPQTRSVAVEIAGMQVDLGGIAKGYALDLAAEAMKKAGATAGLVDVGGDIVAFGRKPDGSAWRIGVRDPSAADRSIYGIRLALTDAAVATSGVQERFYEIGGQRYSHIIDPRTGRPAAQAPSVTVIAPDGITADAWATVFSVLPPEEGLALWQDKLAEAGVQVMWMAGAADAPVTAKTPGFDAFLIK